MVKKHSEKEETSGKNNKRKELDDLLAMVRPKGVAKQCFEVDAIFDEEFKIHLACHVAEEKAKRVETDCLSQRVHLWSYEIICS